MQRGDQGADQLVLEGEQGRLRPAPACGSRDRGRCGHRPAWPRSRCGDAPTARFPAAPGRPVGCCRSAAETRRFAPGERMIVRRGDPDILQAGQRVRQRGRKAVRQALSGIGAARVGKRQHRDGIVHRAGKEGARLRKLQLGVPKPGAPRGCLPGRRRAKVGASSNHRMRCRRRAAWRMGLPVGRSVAGVGPGSA